MSCEYHRDEPLEIHGLITNVKVYVKPINRTVFKSVKVTWFRKITVNVDGVIHRLYDFQEQGKPSTRSVVDKGAKNGVYVDTLYFPVSKRTDLRGCIKLMEVASGE